MIGNPVTLGNEIYFKQLNEAGGVAGKYPVELIIRDTKYEAPTAAQEYQATKDDVAMYVQVLGTQVVSSLLPDLTADASSPHRPPSTRSGCASRTCCRGAGRTRFR